ncbi:MAG TPA: ATP-binding cassette domain-containing protein [Amycolatopsis sp.]|nr:ATP-binding cassette domain-containing protein [Amycolatopsis sp.]
MLEIENVRLVYNAGRSDELTALDGLSLTLPGGQFTTVIGSNGAGKSSLIQIISGAVRPTSGRVRLDGTDVTRHADHRRAGRIARVFDDPRAGTAPELSIEDNLALALARGRRRTLRFALSAKRRALMREHLARIGLGLEDRLGDRVGLLSAGQRQSLTMVMAGLSGPSVLLLDEHLAALDPGTAARVLTLTRELVAELGATSLMITHNMEHALALGERLLVLSRGRIIGDLDAETKRATTVDGLVDMITASQDTVSDRLLIGERA